jgi:N-methylhydantoinase B
MLIEQTWDPVSLEILASRLLSVATEQQATLVRSAFSTVVRESEDLACGVFDARGRMLAQSITGTPGHINPMATGVRHFLRAYPPQTLRPGDVLITNDPWFTSGQINDITVLTPVFLRSQLIGFFANCCHMPDIGGRVLSGEASDVYEEGLRIPILKLFAEHTPNETLLGVIRANSRSADETLGDLHAMVAANDVGADSLRELLDEFGIDSLDPVSDELLARSERALRDAIRELPNGSYEHETWCDGIDVPLRLAVRVIIEDDAVEIDFAGTSPQTEHGINVVFNYTHGYASFAIKAAIAPDVPHNDGSFRPVTVKAPEGSILNCTPPAAVAGRHLIGHFIPSLIFGALAKAVPGCFLAAGADPIWITIWRGARRPSGDPFSLTLFQAGGMGARASKDGLATTGFPSGVAGVPVEVIEALTPLIVHRRELRPDSGGPGRFRGGVGQRTEFACSSGEPYTVSPLIDRTKIGAAGHEGGLPGAPGQFLLSDGATPAAKQNTSLAPHVRVILNLPGGGGFADPLDRAPERVMADVVDGYVSLQAAKRDYGVVVLYVGPPDRIVRPPELYRLDLEATERIRAQRRTS